MQETQNLPNIEKKILTISIVFFCRHQFQLLLTNLNQKINNRLNLSKFNYINIAQHNYLNSNVQCNIPN